MTSEAAEAPVLSAARPVATGLPDFRFLPETEAIAAFYVSPPTRRRKRSMDDAIRRLKDGGVWDRIKRFGVVGSGEDETFRDWKDPNFVYPVIGTVAVDSDRWVRAETGSALRTGLSAADLDSTSHSVLLYTPVAGLTPSGSDFGALASSGLGISLNLKGASGYPTLRSACGPLTGMATRQDWEGTGAFGFSRRDAEEVHVFKGPVHRAAVQAAAAALDPLELYLLGSNAVGTAVGTSRRKIFAWMIGEGLSDAGMALVADVMRTLNVEYVQGAFDTYDAGHGEGEISADLVVYGATSMGAVAAREAVRQGRRVVVCGGWRDRHVGGMSAAGLGYGDFYALNAMGGMPRWILDRIATLSGRKRTRLQFEPRFFDQVMRELLDPKNPNGADVPIYWSDGVIDVASDGGRIRSFRTADGRRFTARYFIDASYEGDLIRRAGLSVTKGREAAGIGTEAANGFRGIATDRAAGNHQFKDHTGALLAIDPFVEAGDPASGLLPNIAGIYEDDDEFFGSADEKIQSFNFRQTLTTNKARCVPMPVSPPAGYDPMDYEALGRLFERDPALRLESIMLNFGAASINEAGDVFDINARGGLSSDLWGAATPYPAADYAEREVIWKRHETFIRGLWWWLQHAPDERVPGAVRAAARTYGFDAFHYARPHPRDAAHWMPQLYVREAWRLVGDLVVDGNDIDAQDGTAPRSAKTIGVASYALDSHSVQALAHRGEAGWRIWNEGNFEDQSAGAKDRVAPIPYEAILPKAAECENLASVFAVSATHVAFGAIRMEFTSMMLAQAAAIAVRIAMDHGDQALQAVDYEVLRAALLESPTLPGEAAPVLPQVN